jgi:hypothetical protein
VSESPEIGSEALCEALGLPEGEQLDLLQVAPTTVTLVRRRPEEEGLPVAPPALHAEVETFPLAFVLRAIHGSGQSGLLRFRYRDHRKSVWIRRGEVVFATSNQRVDRLGECLLRAGVIQLGMLREAERSFQVVGPGDRFGKVLVERGFLTPRELWNGVKYQVEEVVRSLFAYGSGTVSFWEGDIEPDNVVRLSLPTARLVEEGLQRSAELAKFLAVLRDPRVSLARVEGCSAELAGNERALADAIGAGRDFEDVCRVLDFDFASAARSIQLLRLVGAVKLMRLPEAGGLTEDESFALVDRDSLQERVSGLTKWINELASLVAQADGGWAGVLERLGRVLDDTTGRFPALLTGVELRPGASLDVDVLVSRGLKLPGQREDQLASALGELIAYLEFEVKDHPAIAAPDELLTRLRGSLPTP